MKNAVLETQQHFPAVDHLMPAAARTKSGQNVNFSVSFGKVSQQIGRIIKRAFLGAYKTGAGSHSSRRPWGDVEQIFQPADNTLRRMIASQCQQARQYIYK